MIFDDSNENNTLIFSLEKSIDFNTFPGSPLNK